MVRGDAGDGNGMLRESARCCCRGWWLLIVCFVAGGGLRDVFFGG